MADLSRILGRALGGILLVSIATNAWPDSARTLGSSGILKNAPILSDARGRVLVPDAMVRAACAEHDTPKRRHHRDLLVLRIAHHPPAREAFLDASTADLAERLKLIEGCEDLLRYGLDQTGDTELLGKISALMAELP